MTDPRTTRLDHLCDAFRRRLRLLLAAVGLARVVSLAVLLFAGLLLVDWWLHLPTAARVVTLLIYLSAILISFWLTLVVPLRERWSNAAVLAHLDATVPESQGMLLDLHDLLTGRDRIAEVQGERGRQLAAEAVSRLGPLAETVPLSQAFQQRRVNRWLAVGGGLILGLVLAGIAWPTYLAIGAERLFNPFARTRWPHRTTITVQRPDNGWAVPQLESFTVQAEVSGDVPAQVTLAYRPLGTRNWSREKLPMQERPATDGDRPARTVTHHFPEVREALEFTLEGGDYQTDPQEIAIIQRPFLKSITAHYQYPRYAGLPDRTVAGGQLAGIEGTQVQLSFDCSMPLERAAFVFTPEGAGATAERTELTQRSPTTFEKTLLLERDGRYAVELYEANGYREARPEVYEIRVTPDDPPEIELLAPGKDLLETRQATVEVAFRARDKLGLAKVEFLYQLGDAETAPLSDRITGPIAQTGTDVPVRFTWDLRKMELPEAGTLGYFVRVQDNNPTGRGKVQSPPGQIKLVKPSEFHLEALERAKILEEEARIAWRNQLQAWRRGGQWLAKGTGAEDDPLWTEMAEAQQKSFAAARQIKFHFQALTEKYERNHMGQDFMAGRLSAIAELLSRLLDQEHAPIVEGLATARPRSAADAAPDRLKSLRGDALGRFKDRQKMAVLVLERLLRRLYDWRDLQTCTVTAKLLHEQQEEVLDRTQVLAPKTIAKEIEDLKEADQEKLLTLGKQQRAIFDTETGLENQLTYLMYKAERQARKTILDPLQAAFRNLRNNRVNDHLKRSAELIENNQPAQIIDNQKAALRALQVVQAGLVQAGQKVDPEEPLTLALSPSEENQFDPDQVKPELVKRDPDKPEEVKPVEPTDTPSEVPTLPEGTDPLSAAIRLAFELQDNVLSRARYLDKNRGPGEMPRFVQLKTLRLGERQDAARKGLEQSLQEAAKKNEAAVTAILTAVGADMDQNRALIKAGVIGPGPQQFQADSMDRLRGLLQHLAFVRAVDDAVAENRRLKGVDAFGRKYLLRDKDLDAAVAGLTHLHIARLLLGDAQRKLERFQQFPAQDEPLRSLEKSSRVQAADELKEVTALLDAVKTPFARLSPEVVSRLQELEVPRAFSLPLAEHVERGAAGKADAEVLPALRAANQTLATAVQALRDVLEERVREEPKVVAQDAPRMTLEQFQQLTSRENLARLLKDEGSLPPEVRERMIRALEKEFPARYRELLQAYYGSFITPKKDEKK